MSMNTQERKITTASLSFPPPYNYASPKIPMHRDFYASRQRFLRSYPFTRKADQMTAGKKMKKWFRTSMEKAKSIKSKVSRHLCPCGQNLSKHFFLQLVDHSSDRPLKLNRSHFLNFRPKIRLICCSLVGIIQGITVVVIWDTSLMMNPNSNFNLAINIDKLICSTVIELCCLRGEIFQCDQKKYSCVILGCDRFFVCHSRMRTKKNHIFQST